MTVDTGAPEWKDNWHIGSRAQGTGAGFVSSAFHEGNEPGKGWRRHDRLQNEAHHRENGKRLCTVSRFPFCMQRKGSGPAPSNCLKKGVSGFWWGRAETDSHLPPSRPTSPQSAPEAEFREDRHLLVKVISAETGQPWLSRLQWNCRIGLAQMSTYSSILVPAASSQTSGRRIIQKWRQEPLLPTVCSNIWCRNIRSHTRHRRLKKNRAKADGAKSENIYILLRLICKKSPMHFTNRLQWGYLFI